MARQVKLKPFFLGLGAIAVIGVGAIWMAWGGGSAPTEAAPLPVSAGSFEGYVLGSDTAAVEVVEYADFQCPACARFAILTAPEVKAQLVNTGRVRWRFMDFPLPSHDKAELVHHAAACAGEQGGFWAMHDVLFRNQGAWVRSRRPKQVLRDLAEAIGLDVKQYDDCMGSNRYAARIAATKADAVAVGVSSTPSFVIGGLLISGHLAYDSVVTLVERAEAAQRR